MMGPTEPLASGVIAYNDDSERGWNDPPTLSFTTVTASKKGPKIDLRKRVSHQEALTGRRVTSPLTQNPPNLYKEGNNLPNGLSNPVLRQQPQQLSPSVPPSVSPCHSRHSSGTYTPPLIPDAKSYGMVPLQYPIPGPPTTNINPPTNNGPPKIFSPVETTLQSDSGIIHPLTQKSSTTPPMQPPPVTTAPPSNLGKPLFSFPNRFNMAPISSALDTSHVRSIPDISPDISTQGAESFPNINMITQGPLLFTPSPTIESVTPLSVSTVGKRSPVLTRAYQNGNGLRIYTPPPTVNGSGRNSPVVSPAPPPTMNRSPVSTPTGGNSSSSTPRSSTPDNGCPSENTSRHNSEEFDSQEGMKVTVEAIEGTLIKCISVLKAREVEDVKKKIGIMKQLWVDGRLSVPVQITMKLLTEALLDGDTKTANEFHVKLMVDYVSEVKQWMVAIKRLISAVVNINTPVS